ncbi:carbamoyl phosphate synthase small subunit [Oceanobacillus timonensis]|uniref:carbamoyl phosphate synthase small subunit n=1 Tax=Oceanobacillus timonensis TaxID=1926285 RepID=UPI0009B9EC64|nr:carbamoyl phosphate synthase small subunit [Oceanobacillus timonensis]
MRKRHLILEDGTVFEGYGFGSEELSKGEIVFNTGMTGYQEVITDPSYCGQFVTMTYPLIGNYGINRDDYETVTPFIHGLIVKEYSEQPSNFRNEETIDSFLKANHIPGIAGIDTRKLTRIIRKHGTMKAAIVSAEEEIDSTIENLRNAAFRTDQVKQTSTSKPYVVPGRGYRVVLVDFGAKHGILRELTKRDCQITVVPYNYDAADMLRLRPDGIMLTNGPGDPKDVPEAIEMIREIIGQVPIFGICLGHQLLSLACGANTTKMKFGHRGANHPVKDLENDKTYVTSQNHSYAVNPETLENTGLELTQQAINDSTVEGVRHTIYPAFSVQYHPEASPGPEDTNYLFDTFLEMMQQQVKKREVHMHA